MSKSNLYHVISPSTNSSIYFSQYLAEAIQYAESHHISLIHGDDGSIWKYEPHVMKQENKDGNMVVMCWSNTTLEPLSEKLTSWLDEQYQKLLNNTDNKLSNSLPCSICGASYLAHEVEGENGKRGHRINKELAELNGVPYLGNVLHWYTSEQVIPDSWRV